jgi:hypothetical protein
MDKILNVSSKLGFCGMPLRGDTNSTCPHGCTYCFSNARVIRKRQNPFIAKEKSMAKEIENPSTVIGEFLSAGIPIHWGGMSDPFFSPQIAELTTKLSNIIGLHPIMYSSKGVNFDENKFDKETRAFQFSISMSDEMAKVLEPDAPLPSARIQKAIEMKKKGFWVAVRLQPYIPKITDEIVPMLKQVEWDYIVIEGLKIVPQSPDDYKNSLIASVGLKRDDFFQFGLLNLNLQLRVDHYSKFLQELEGYKIGMGDNDLHFLSDSSVCCGTDTIKGWNNYFSTTTHLVRTKEYISENDLSEMWFPNGSIKSLFTSNRVEGDRDDLFGKDEANTTREYFKRRFYKDGSPFSPSMNTGFMKIGNVYKNPFFGKSRIEVLQALAAANTASSGQGDSVRQSELF